MAKGIRDYGTQKLADYHTESNGEQPYKVVADPMARRGQAVNLNNRPDGDAQIKVPSGSGGGPRRRGR